MSRLIKICIVNRNYPPHPGATGENAAQLVAFFRSNPSFECHIVCIGNHKGDAHNAYVKERYNGKNKAYRLFATLLESYQLIKKAKRCQPDVFIILTDPPFLNFWAARLLQQEYWISWTMDIYPEAFAANHLVSTNNLFYKKYQAALRQAPPKKIICLGPKQAEYLKSEYYPEVPSLVIPAGLIVETSVNSERKNHPEWYTEKKIILGYVGSIGEAHDAQAVIELACQLNADRFQLVLSCSGSKANAVKKKLKNLRAVFCTDYLPPDEMHYIDIQIVTLLPQWTHISVPSKALSALSYHSAILFMGNGFSDTWGFVHAAGWRASNGAEITEFLKDVSTTEVLDRREQAKNVARDLVKTRNDAYSDLANNLLKIEL